MKPRKAFLVYDYDDEIRRVVVKRILWRMGVEGNSGIMSHRITEEERAEADEGMEMLTTAGWAMMNASTVAVKDIKTSRIGRGSAIVTYRQSGAHAHLSCNTADNIGCHAPPL